MDERELEAWAAKHRELGRRARAERRRLVAAVLLFLSGLVFAYFALPGDGYGGGPLGPLLF
jgi:hypothetical protein